MVRKLAIALAWLGFLLPGWAYALGLGELELNSYLNQPLDAEIEIVSAGNVNLDGIRVGLAPRADFARVGVDYHRGLRLLEMSVEYKSDGTPYIHITSDDAYREPFLEFLVEVNWARGRVLRRYTALVDPATMRAAERPEPQAPRVAAPTPSKPAPTPAPTAAADDRFPRVPITDGGSGAPEPRPAAPATGPSRDEYGPTQSSDTLWQIAKDVRPDDSVSIEQTMIALLRKNPDAFIDDNINQLKRGQVLKVPSRQEITQLSAGEARAEARRQYQAWRQKHQAAAEPQPEPESPPAGASAREGRLKVVPPDSESGKAVAAGDSSGAAGTDAETRRKLALAREAAEAQRQENTELRSRVKQLEERIKAQEDLVAVKDERLAALQRQLRELREQQKAAEAAPAQPAAEDAGSEAPVAEGPDGAGPAEEEGPASGEEPMAADAESADKPPKQIVMARPAPGQPTNPYMVGGYARIDPTTLPKKPVSTQPFKPAPEAAGDSPSADRGGAGWQARVTGYANQAWGYAQANPAIVGGGAGAVVLLLLLGIVMRQRRRAAAGFPESILEEPQPEPVVPQGSEAGAGAEPEAQEPESDTTQVLGSAQNMEQTDSSYLSDFAISGMDSLQSEVGEADPLTEADVFLAYGRFQPAESMIKEAIENEPERLDLKVKLLEIYHAARDVDSFQREAEALDPLMEDKSDALWAKVMEMGRELLPDHRLFTETPEADVTQPVAEPEAGEREEAAADQGLDFDLGDFEVPKSGESGTGETQEPAGEGDFGLDFELESGAQQEAGGDEDTDQLATDLAQELSEIAESIKAGEAEQGEAGAEEAQDEEPFTIDFDMGEESQTSGEEPSLGGEEFAGEAQPEAGEDADIVEGGVLGEVDEVGTKLDLARAYMDMGDPEGARSILEEVLEEGNDDQKGEAQKLMDQIP